MSSTSRELAGFARSLTAPKPYLGDLVIVGGWAHRLYKFHDAGGSTGFPPLMTEDADIAAPARMPQRGASIAEILKGEGFVEELSGEESPPVSRYHLGDEGGGLYVEFIAPLKGSGFRRDGRSDATAIVAGV